MDGEGTSGQKQKGRRVWRKCEEDALMRIMSNEIVDKWRGDIGFKAGFFTLLEKEMGKVLPESNIKANPHIDSKVKYWRQTYAKVQDVFNLSGFGWDDVLKRIVCDHSVWVEYEKANKKKSKCMYGKSFPYYDQWVFLFGKDRATREGAEDPHEMAQNDPNDVGNDHNNATNEGDLYFPHFGDEFLNISESDMPTHIQDTQSATNVGSSTPSTATPHSSLPTGTPRAPIAPSSVGTNKGKKRGRITNEEVAIQASMDAWLKESSGHMGEMAKSMGHDKDQSSFRKNIAKELKELNLTTSQRFKLSAIITSCEEKMDDFYGQDEEEKQQWVEAVLNGDVYGPI